MIKACFFDIDGTLYDHQTNCIPTSNKKAIYTLQQQGIPCGIATGRHLLEIEEANLLEDLHFDWLVTLNGQLCYYQNKLVHALPIDKQAIGKILHIATENEIALIIVEENRMTSLGHNHWMEQAQAAVHTSIPPQVSMHPPYPAIYQISAFGLPEQLSKFQTIDTVHVTHWHPGAIDLIPKNGNKTAGIEQLLKDFHISIKEIMAFGDGANDIEMLKAAGIGVAMGNACDQLKQHASYVTTSIEQDGIINALKHFSIIHERKENNV